MKETKNEAAKADPSFRQVLRTSPMDFWRLWYVGLVVSTVRWLETVAMPGIDTDSITHQHLLRSMDALMEHQAVVDETVAQLLRPLIDEELSVVFYDLTTVGVEGSSELPGDVREYGMNRTGFRGGLLA